ncbi:MAG: GNAT family N-acetyltransferase [Candidatus Limnocylindrales bacterium]
MDDAQLAALEHENLIAGMAFVGSNIDGAVVRRVDGVALIGSGLPVRLFNQVLIEGDGPSPDVLADAVQVLRDRVSPFVVNLRIGADDGVLPIISGLGLVPLSTRPWMPGMALHPVVGRDANAPGAPSSGATATDHDIHRVTDAAGLEDHIRAAASGFEMDADLVRMIMAGTLDAGDTAHVYVGYTDGQPVTSGLGLRTGRTIGVYNIATVPEVRKRGYGAAMTTRIVDDAVAAGCDVAVLQASEMGFAIYKRLGYRTVVEYMAYVDPAARA